MTLGPTKGVDILVSDPRTDRMFRLEVKTNHKKSSRSAGGNSKLFGKFFSAWMMRDKHEQLKDPKLFYCFVNISSDTKQFRFFIVPSHVVADYVREENQLWLGEKESRSKEATMRTFRIGTDAERYPIQTPTIEKYENNWDFRE